jgi:hypothetical protein
MGMKETVELRLAEYVEQAEELEPRWVELAEEPDIRVAVGQLLGVAYATIGALCDLVTELAEHIDGLEEYEED